MSEQIAKVLSEHVVITDGLYEPTGWCATCGNLSDGDQENHQAFALFVAGYRSRQEAIEQIDAGEQRVPSNPLANTGLSDAVTWDEVREWLATL